MKKLLLLTLLGLGAASAAQAQDIRLGLKAGANYSNLAGDLTDENRYDSKVGPHAGLMVNIGLTDDNFLSVQPELLFSQKGFKYADNSYTDVFGNRIKETGKVNYNYLDVPILLKINADGIFFEAGPQVGYLLSVSNNVRREVNGNVTNNSSNYDNLDNVQRTELGYAAGVGYESDMGLLIGLRYNGGLSKYGKKDAAQNEFSNARNSTFMLSLGYFFGK
ncbi:porin family protein [Hymenobacter latericus]|uniref:porin family protein n=1 Tax=Hymenobacter sp. YIM 151858-1 TaxID=2987688 RepID=UPI002227B555|nr:porin family protein [Hymenobacter sp. YIM 151858-1]UYZ58796.1 PorT family protein [Hymenobacter sp. YIM 151858-1]